MEENWEGSYEDDTTQKGPIDEHLQLFLTFAQEHETTLQTILNTTRSTIGDAPDTHYRPIRMALETIERVYPQDFFDIPTFHQTTSTKSLQKILSVIIFLQDEISELKNIAETKFISPLIMFGTVTVSPDVSVEVSGPSTGRWNVGQREQMIGSFLPLLQEICNFIDRCYNVALNLIQQLGSLVSSKSIIYKNVFQGTHLQSIFFSLGELLSILITFDLIIQQNDILLECWSYYKSMLTSIRAEPSQFSTNIDDVSKFERLIVSIDQTLMIGEIYKGCIEQDFELIVTEENHEHLKIRTNSVFLSELLFFIKSNLDHSLNVINTNTELDERFGIMISMALYVLYRQLLPSNQPPDMKLHKLLWNVQKIIPFLVLYDKILWTIAEFLQTFVPFDIKRQEISNPVAYRRQYIHTFDSQLTSKTLNLVAQCNAWYIICETKLQSSLRYEVSNTLQTLDMYGSILLKGLSLVYRASYLVTITLTTHSTMQIPLSKSNLNDLSLLIEHLKAIEFTFLRKDLIITESLIHIIHQLSDAIVKLLKPIKLKIESIISTQKSDSAKALDMFNIIIVLENLLKGTENFTSLRLLILQLLSDILITSTYFTEKESNKFKQFVKRIVVLSKLIINIKVVTNTQYLYFHLDLFQPMIASIYQNSTESNRIQYLIASFLDGIRLIYSTKHLNQEEYHHSKNNYRSFLKSILMKEIIEPLSHDIETDLRLHVHTKHLDHMQIINPKTENLRPFQSFLNIPSIHLLGQIVTIKDEVIHYLDKNFYNLTTVALHDWRMYAEMRSVAYEKFNLRLLNNFLPMGSLDQGLDVLQIMRNIHIFVSRFTYNMNIQQFIEFRPTTSAVKSTSSSQSQSQQQQQQQQQSTATSKHLNTIRIQSIAASIRQHGLGVLNTTVNFTYQFLTQKFHIFREFLHDDYIRAHLAREHRWYKKHRHDPDVNNMYPYDRALKFTKEIKKLGINEAGKSFLDLFRMTITEIGNALGYVRMVRSASMYYCSEAVKYLPELEDIISFADHSGKGIKIELPMSVDDPKDRPAGTEGDYLPCTGANFSEETILAGKNLDEVIATYIKNFGEGNDYFKVLVNVFQTVLLSDDNDDLKNFFMIVFYHIISFASMNQRLEADDIPLPSLCISWTDASLQAKDNMFKATRGVTKEMYFTDDGFAIGIAYCLAILKQTRKSEALHWFDTYRAKLKQDAKVLEQQQAARAAKEAKIKEQKEKAAKKQSTFSFFGTSKKQEDANDRTVDEDYEDMEEIHTLQTTAKRLEAQRREMEQLFYSLNGAAIFFKRTDVDI